MENRQSLTARLAGWDPSIRESDVLLPLPVPLSGEIGHSGSLETEGIAALLRDRFVIYEGGMCKESIPLSEMESFSFREGIGCVFAEGKMKNGEHRLLCRADMHYKALYAAAL